MNKKYLFIALIVLVIVAWWQPLNFGQTEVTIPGDVSAREIARSLADQRILRNVEEFLFWLKITGRERNLKAGTYELYKFKNPLYVIDRLTSGGKSEVIVTIPEGLTIYETARILADHGLIDESRFLELCHDEEFINEIGLNVPSLEGYFFPDTYSFSRLQNEAAIITTFARNFFSRIAKLGMMDGDSLHEVIILASIVEKEAKHEEERPIIAKVFLNRLKSKRPLESCATIFYILKLNDPQATARKLADRDLQIGSPYNTYLNFGLPPGPICSPGESAIMAVMSPADVDYLYFVAKGDGRHHFSRTFREHMTAKDKYQ